MTVSKLESRMFVGKTQRQWGSTIPTWYLNTPAWVLTITRTAMGNHYWLLTSRVTRLTKSGTAVTLRGAETEAGEASGQRLDPVKQQKIGQCAVCGSTGWYTRLVGEPLRAVRLCPHHQYVCRTHLADPCPECDSR